MILWKFYSIPFNGVRGVTDKRWVPQIRIFAHDKVYVSFCEIPKLIQIKIYDRRCTMKNVIKILWKFHSIPFSSVGGVTVNILIFVVAIFSGILSRGYIHRFQFSWILSRGYIHGFQFSRLRKIILALYSVENQFHGYYFLCFSVHFENHKN